MAVLRNNVRKIKEKIEKISQPIREQLPIKVDITSFDILKMYKKFPNERNPEDNTIGYCLTKILMNNGEVWYRITSDSCARGKPKGYKEREWKRLEVDYDKPEVIRGKWLAQGFRVPTGYWCGPPELHPNVLKRAQIAKIKQAQRTMKQEETKWTPEWLREIK